MSGYTIWFTGLPCSNKEKVAQKLVKMIQDSDIPVVYLTDDSVRKTLCYDIGYTRYDWDRHTLRLVHMCYHITASNILNVVSSVSPSRRVRNYGRNLIGTEKFIEIYAKCSEEISNENAEQLTQENILQDSNSFIYEKPNKPQLVINADKMTINDSLSVVVDFIAKHRIV